jgi:hypothetical protein
LPSNGILDGSRQGRLATDWLVCNCAAHDEKSRNGALKRGRGEV